MTTKEPRQTGDAGAASRSALYARIAKTPGATNAIRSLSEFDDPEADAWADVIRERGD